MGCGWRVLRGIVLFVILLATPIFFFDFFFEMAWQVLIVSGIACLLPLILAVLAKKSRNIRVVPGDETLTPPPVPLVPLSPSSSSLSTSPPASPTPTRPPPSLASWSSSSSDSLPLSFPPSSSPPSRLGLWLDVLSHNSANTMYQNLLIVFSCVVYVRACYSLSYDTEHGEKELAYHLVDTPTNLSAFEIAECFLAVTFGLDLFLRAHGSDRHALQLNTYFFVDMLAFSSFLATAQMAPTESTKVHYYNAYVASGIFRFLRLRRTIKKLDRYKKRADIVFHIYRRTWVLPWRSAGMIILALKVAQYILSSASLIMFAEFPCPSLIEDPESCTLEYRDFHRCLYFVVVTLSTVGYGDMTPKTDLGVVVVFLIIVIGALCVPLAVQEFHILWQDATADETVRRLTTLEKQADQLLECLQKLESLDEKTQGKIEAM